MSKILKEISSKKAFRIDDILKANVYLDSLGVNWLVIEITPALAMSIHRAFEKFLKKNKNKKIKHVSCNGIIYTPNKEDYLFCYIMPHFENVYCVVNAFPSPYTIRLDLSIYLVRCILYKFNLPFDLYEVNTHTEYDYYGLVQKFDRNVVGVKCKTSDGRIGKIRFISYCDSPSAKTFGIGEENIDLEIDGEIETFNYNEVESIIEEDGSETPIYLGIRYSEKEMPYFLERKIVDGRVIR